MAETAAQGQPPRYGRLHRWLHWIVAVVVAGMLIAGFILGFLGFSGTKEAFGLPATNAIYFLHKSFGVTLLILMAVRLYIRARDGKPAYDPPIEPWQRKLSTSVHHLLYIVLIAQPIVGWLATGAGGFPVTFFGLSLPGFLPKDEELSAALYGVHGALGFVLLALVAFHVAGALYHWKIRRDTVIKRMSLFGG